jgi:outer membrane biosynthesis protein TonB
MARCVGNATCFVWRLGADLFTVTAGGSGSAPKKASKEPVDKGSEKAPIKSDSKPEPKAESKPEPKPEPKAESKPEPKAEAPRGESGLRETRVCHTF